MSIKYKWFVQPEMLVGLSALIVSLVAVVVSLYSASIDREFARASVWPRVAIYRNFNQGVNENEASNFSYSISNNGTGPALIKYAKVSYKDKVYQSWQNMIRDSNIATQLNLSQSHISTSVLPATHVINAFSTRDPHLVGELLNHDAHIQIELCYCSIYDQCWVSDRTNIPKEVNACYVKESEAFQQ